MNVSCLNCSLTYEGKFCPECGQKALTHRITFGGILHDIPHSVWHVDKGFTYTFVQLLKRPGHAIREFVSGQRIRHYSPFAYLFIMSAASSLFSHVKAFYFLKVHHIRLGINPDLPYPRMAEFFDKYPALMLCLIIPAMSLWTFVFNRKTAYNYSENLVLNTFLVSQFNLFFILHDTVAMAFGWYSVSMIPLITVFCTYTSIGYIQFFPKDNSFWGIGKKTAMCLMIVLTLITGLSVTGFMTPWWAW